jgi:hypothetical protein
MQKTCPVALVALLIAAAALPAAAQALDPAPLLPQELWESMSFHTPEGAANWELQPAAEPDETPWARVNVAEVPENRWEIGFSWATAGPIAAGDALVLSFEARAEGEQDPPGSIHLAFRRAEKPYHHALSETVSVGEQWQQFQVPMSSTVEMPAGQGSLRVNLGTGQQSVEIRNLTLRNYGGELSYLALCRVLGIDPAAGGRQPVRQHLTPSLLWEMRVFDDLPAPNPDFDPDGAWEQTWRIWTCYGYIARANRDLGLLRIERTPGDPVTLDVQQVRLNQEGLQHIETAEIACEPDSLCSPLAWEIATTFVSPEGEELADLGYSRSVAEPPADDVTADWALFEAVQRLPFDDSVEYQFDLLQDLTLLKREQTLRYDGVREVRFGMDTRTLHRFVQTGHGLLPFEYWLDPNHRLVLVVSHYRVYVLDPNAEETLANVTESYRSRYERRKARYAPDPEDDDGE